MRVYMIRHGATKGNLEHRYVGRTDEELTRESREGLALLRQSGVLDKTGPGGEVSFGRVYVSPMARCRQTAELLFPGIKQCAVEDFRECDFGEFEYKCYAELNGNPAYQRFIDTEGKSGFPKGESMEGFRERCVRGFLGILEDVRKRGPAFEEAAEKAGEREAEDLVLVVHGGTIMAILDGFSCPHGDYYDWQAGNGHGFSALLDVAEDGKIRLCNIERL